MNIRLGFLARAVSSAWFLTLSVGATEPAKPTAPVVPEPGWLGLGFTCHEKPKSSSGCDSLVVVALRPGGPAARSGLQVSDIITEMNGKATRFASHSDALNAFRKFRAGLVIRLKVFRDQKQLVLRLTAAPMPAGFANKWQKNDVMAREEDARRGRSGQNKN